MEEDETGDPLHGKSELLSSLYYELEAVDDGEEATNAPRRRKKRERCLSADERSVLRSLRRRHDPSGQLETCSRTPEAQNARFAIMTEIVTAFNAATGRQLNREQVRKCMQKIQDKDEEQEMRSPPKDATVNDTTKIQGIAKRRRMGARGEERVLHQSPHLTIVRAQEDNDNEPDDCNDHEYSEHDEYNDVHNDDTEDVYSDQYYTCKHSRRLRHSLGSSLDRRHCGEDLNALRAQCIREEHALKMSLMKEEHERKMRRAEELHTVVINYHREATLVLKKEQQQEQSLSVARAQKTSKQS